MVEKRSEPLAGRTLYVPQMCSGTAVLFAAAFRALGVDARVCPDSDARTRELAAKFCTGDECYPQIVTMGDFLKVTEQEDFSAQKTAFFMPTTSGPCRFGQYSHLVRRMLRKISQDDVLLISPNCEDNYSELGESGPNMMHYGWWAIVAGDLLRKMLFRVRPYERVAGQTDQVYWDAIRLVEKSLTQMGRSKNRVLNDLETALRECRSMFDAIPADYSGDRLLIGVVGEIYCRLNNFANDHVLRSIEQAGGEVWLADVTEWVYYANFWAQEEVRAFGNRYSLTYLKGWVSDLVQHREEERLHHIFADALIGLEEPGTVKELIDLGQPYIEPHAAMGEMILNLSKSVWLHKHGADGVLDISPFSCMNGVVCEAIYPTLSRDLAGIPIRIMYFDGNQRNLEEDLAIFMEMAAHYRGGKIPQRAWPVQFENGIETLDVAIN